MAFNMNLAYAMSLTTIVNVLYESNLDSDYLVNQAYWNVRDFYKEQQQERALLEELKSRRLQASALWQRLNGDRLTPPLNKRAQFGQYIHGGKNRGAGNGRWNASNGPINIFSSEGEMMGERRSLVYYNSKEKIPAKKTRWIMNEYRLPNPQPAIMSDSSSKDPFWTLCKIGETGRTSGDDDQVLPPPRPQPQQHQILQQATSTSWMETIKKRGHDDQRRQVYDEEEPSPKRAKARVAN
ncbi:hypothetical protein Scep_025406 [Stephania cephalantha]|uniref:NAC domain-containing protein n=1 Tax=Stephania cephalantha TaxID=152367 RepID=A0AAP0ELI4_9MAGN